MNSGMAKYCLTITCALLLSQFSFGVGRPQAPRRPAAAGLPTALELALPGMERLAADVWVARVAPGLWVHTTTRTYPDGTVYPANGMLLETRRGSVLFDTGWTEAQTAALLGWARARKKPVLRAFVTHAHEDRIGGIRTLTQNHIPVYGLALTRETARGQGAPALPEAVAGLDSKARRDPEGFELFYPGPGHARDNIVVYFGRQRTLFGGCLVKSVTSPNLGNTADAVLDEWPKTIERVRRTYPAARVVVPGHGTVRGDPLARTLELLADRPAAKAARGERTPAVALRAAG